MARAIVHALLAECFKRLFRGLTSACRLSTLQKAREGASVQRMRIETGVARKYPPRVA
jgi:hypothetical protein